MPIPETEKQHADVIDLLTDACRNPEDVESEDGKISKQLVLKPKKVWYKTLMINSPTFGRLAFELENFLAKASDCYNNMSYERASVLSEQIHELVDTFYLSLDAKSSESMRDKNNTNSTLVHVLTRNKIEKQYSMKEEYKKSIFDGIVGNERHENRDD